MRVIFYKDELNTDRTEWAEAPHNLSFFDGLEEKDGNYPKLFVRNIHFIPDGVIIFAEPRKNSK